MSDGGIWRSQGRALLQTAMMLVDPLSKNALWLNCEWHFWSRGAVILVCKPKIRAEQTALLREPVF
jgi:hypothetical protein